MKRICVFCGSSVGSNGIYKETAIKLGTLLVKHNIQLVYGAGNIGLMGVLADTMLNLNGKVSGIIPKLLVEKEVVHADLTELIIVDSMHQRKALMTELSDGFIVLPGGFGTLDEMFEVLTWKQLNIIQKPLGLLNINGYFDNLILFLENAVSEKFIRPEHKENLIIGVDENDLLLKLINYEPIKVHEKWIDELREKNTY